MCPLVWSICFCRWVKVSGQPRVPKGQASEATLALALTAPAAGGRPWVVEGAGAPDALRAAMAGAVLFAPRDPAAGGASWLLARPDPRSRAAAHGRQQGMQLRVLRQANARWMA